MLSKCTNPAKLHSCDRVLQERYTGKHGANSIFVVVAVRVAARMATQPRVTHPAGSQRSLVSCTPAAASLSC